MSEFRLPEGWAYSSIADFVLNVNGSRKPVSLSERASIKGEYPYYGATGQIDALNNYTHEGEHVLIGEDGANLLSKSKDLAFIVKGKFWVNNHAHALRCLAGVPSKYLASFVNSIDLTPYVTGSAQPKLTKGNLDNIEIPVAPLAEQQQIAQKLDELLSQVDILKNRLDAISNILKRFRQSVLAAAVSGRLTEEWRGINETPIKNNLLKEIGEYWAEFYKIKNKKFKPPVIPALENPSEELPESWISTQIGYVFDVHVGATPSRAEKSYWGGEVNWVSSSEVSFCRIKSTKEKITEEGLKSASTTVHPKGTVMLAMIGQGKTRGQVGILDIEACHNQNTAALRVPEDYASSMYLYFYLTKQYEETRRVGSGNNQQALNKATVQGLPFPLPPLEEQTEIVRRVEQLFAYADQIEQRVKDAQARVNHLTQSVLAKAFRGELTADWRAQNPELISGENSAAALLERIKAERETVVKKGGKKAAVAAKR